MEKGAKEKLIYISLREASETCDYTQEYLSLRARQGKLKSVKFGKNWITTKEWLDEYIKKSQEYNSVHNKKTQKIKNIERKDIPQVLTVARAAEAKKIKIIKVPKNLPIRKEPKLRFGFAAALVLVLILAGGFFSQKVFFDYALKNILFLTRGVAWDNDKVKDSVNSEILTADLQEKFKEYLGLLFSAAKTQFINIKTRVIFFGNFINEKVSEESKKEATIIYYIDEKNELIREKIINFFYQ